MELKSSFPEEEIFYIMNELIDGLCKAQARKSSILELDANRSREIWLTFKKSPKLTQTPEILKNLDEVIAYPK